MTGIAKKRAKKTKVISKSKKSSRRSRKNILSRRWILGTSILIGIILFIVGTSTIFGYLWLAKNKHLNNQLYVQPNFNSIYMQNLLKKNYVAIWDQYAPSYRDFLQKTVGKEAYFKFLQQKFSDINYGTMSMTPCLNGQTIFPYGTERLYKHTCISYLKMSMTTQNSSAAAQLWTYASLPVILHKSGKSYQILGGGPTDLQAPVLYPQNIVSTTQHIPIVMYHLIQPIPSRSHYESNYGWRLDVGLTVTPESFASQLNLLQKQGYHPISPNDMFNNLYYGLPLPNKPILLTFDDGRISDFTYGLPLLLHHHFTAVFFIPPGLSGKVIGLDGHNTYMTFSQLKILAQDGMYIENHSLYHTQPLWDLAPSVLQLQLSQANNELESLTQYPIQYVAYDGTWPSRNWAQTTPAIQQTMTVLLHMGFALAFQDTGINLALEDTKLPFQIPRIRGINTTDIAFITRQ